MIDNGTETEKSVPTRVNTISTRLRKTFVERDDILCELKNCCDEGGCRTALVGIGGIG